MSNPEVCKCEPARVDPDCGHVDEDWHEVMAMSDAEVDAELREAGGDPDAMVARHRPTIDALLAKRREAERSHPRMTGNTCPCCGEECERDTVDNGIGIVTGPYGCRSCGYSEWPEYDCRAEWARGEPKRKEGGTLDPCGGLTPDRRAP